MPLDREAIPDLAARRSRFAEWRRQDAGPGQLGRMRSSKLINKSIVTIARDEGVIPERRMRVRTTVVKTNIHYPSDSTLLGDGVREPECETAVARDWAGGARQRSD